ncbi:MAG: ATP-dependent helicase [Candidatus Schekmanbacteria bacterium]|nr:ATP-dependent helicase [Candidatus Schekmanbacteria bacterium]
MLDYLADLNEQQRAAVEAADGPILVIAGAGSGKTRTVTCRVAHLIHRGVAPYNILLMTFTNRAAREMRTRVEQVLGLDADLWAGTFHHVALRLLRRHVDRIPYPRGFSILDGTDQQALLRQVARSLPKDLQQQIPKPAVVRHLLGQAAARVMPVEELVPLHFQELVPALESLREASARYRALKVSQSAMDFDDLLLQWLFLLEEHEDIAEAMGRRFRYVLVDEFQDTNALQSLIVDRLVATHRNVMVVGDDAQSIYSFRGANFANIYSFPERFPSCLVVRLEQSYRSSPEIIRLSNESIRHNVHRFDKTLTAARGQGPLPELVFLQNEREQAGFVVSCIQRALRAGVAPNEIAVLYRSHYHTLELDLALRERGVPYELRSGLRFFERAHVKDTVAFLRVLANPGDLVAWQRALGLYPRIGPATADRIAQKLLARLALEVQTGGPQVQARHVWRGPEDLDDASAAALKLTGKVGESWDEARAILMSAFAAGWRAGAGDLGKAPAAELVRAILHSGYVDLLTKSYEDARQRVDDLLRVADFAGGKSLDDFLGDSALAGDSSGVLPGDESAADAAPRKVVLSTVHRAKGLEFKEVYVVWLNEERFPSARSVKEVEGDSGGGEEEERRLFYVACTRAKDRLALCCPGSTRDYTGNYVALEPSRFLRELPSDTYRPVRGRADGHVEDIRRVSWVDAHCADDSYQRPHYGGYLRSR